MDTGPICFVLVLLIGMSYQLEICELIGFGGVTECRDIPCAVSTVQTDCPPNADCIQAVCKCPDGYLDTGSDCIQKCDGGCNDKSTCDQDSLAEPVCVCNDDHYLEEGGVECLPKRGYMEPCNDDMMCKSGVCDLMQSTCDCESDKIDSNGNCNVAQVVTYGDICDSANTLCNEDEFLECTEEVVAGVTVNRCRCEEAYMYNGTACVVDTSNINVTCGDGPQNSSDIARNLTDAKCEISFGTRVTVNVRIEFPMSGSMIIFGPAVALTTSDSGKLTVSMNPALIKCGMGDVHVHLSNADFNIVLTYPAYHSCDNSQKDVSLNFIKKIQKSPPIILKAGLNASLWEQLKMAGLNDDDLQLRLNHVEGDKLKATTPLSPRVVSVFLQQGRGTGFAECNSPGTNSARHVFDGMLTTAEEIPVGGHVSLPQPARDDDYRIPETLAFSGEAELVFAYDLTSSDSDKNCSNNYVVIPVNIKLQNHGPPPRCDVVQNPASNGHQLWASITKKQMVDIWEYNGDYWRPTSNNDVMPMAMDRVRTIKRLIRRLFKRRQYKRFCRRAYRWMLRQLDVKVKKPAPETTDAAIKQLKEKLKEKKLDIKELKKQIREEKAKKGDSVADLKAKLKLTVLEKKVLKNKKKTLKMLSKMPSTYSICASVRSIIDLLKKISIKKQAWTFEEEQSFKFNSSFIEESLAEETTPQNNRLKNIVEKCQRFSNLPVKTYKEYTNAGLPRFHDCPSDFDATFLMSIADSCNTSRKDMKKIDLCEALAVPYFMARGGGKVMLNDIKRHMKKDPKLRNKDNNQTCPGMKPDADMIPFNVWNSKLARVVNGRIETGRFDWFTYSTKWSVIGVCQCDGDTCGDGKRI